MLSVSLNKTFPSLIFFYSIVKIFITDGVFLSQDLESVLSVFFLLKPVLHDWCNKGCGMCYPVCGIMHIKERLLLIGKNSPCGRSGFSLSLSEWSFTICLTPYNRKYNVLSVSLNNTFPSFFLLTFSSCTASCFVEQPLSYSLALFPEHRRRELYGVSSDISQESAAETSVFTYKITSVLLVLFCHPKNSISLVFQFRQHL